MHCKHCGAELDDLQATCPDCGAAQTEEETNVLPLSQEESFEDTLPDGDYDDGEEYEDFEEAPAPKKKNRLGLIALILVVCLAAVGAVLFLTRDKSPYTGPMDSDQYIVAEYKEHTLTNQTFMYYYWAQFYQLYSQYGSSLTYLGLDLNQPFEDQQFGGEDRTWADFFSEYAMQQWSNDMAILDAAKADAFTLSADQQTALQKTLDDLESNAKSAGYDSGEDYLKNSFDLSSDIASYTSYITDSFTVSAYVNAKYDGFLAEGKVDAGTYTDVHYINIRHILIQFADSTDASKAAAKTEAEVLYQSFKKNPTKDNFSALAKEHSDDGSAADGGLIEDVYPGQMVENFENWCFAQGRKENDHGLIETEYGWHLMFFDGFGEVYQTAAEAYAEAQYTAWQDAMFSDLTVTDHSDRITFRHAEK